VTVVISDSESSAKRKSRSRLTAQSVALIIKRWALEAGFDPAPLSGHSLRAGLATAAAKAGKSERSIMKQTGHRSVS
jgi:site-specific recombinase XerD